MNITLSWDPSPDTDITHYRVYYGPSPAHGTITNTSATFLAIDNLPDGQLMYFAVSAVSAQYGESDLSSDITLINPYVTIGRKVGL